MDALSKVKRRKVKNKGKEKYNKERERFLKIKAQYMRENEKTLKEQERHRQEKQKFRERLQREKEKQLEKKPTLPTFKPRSNVKAISGGINDFPFPFYDDPKWVPDSRDYPPYNITDVIEDIPYFGPSIDRPKPKKNPLSFYNFGNKIPHEKVIPPEVKKDIKFRDEHIMNFSKFSHIVSHVGFCNSNLLCRNMRLGSVDHLETSPYYVNIDFSHNRITDVLSLSGMHWLKILNLENNKITTGLRLPTFTHLHAMTLHGNELRSTEGFALQPMLKHLVLTNNKLKDVHGLNANTFPVLKCLELRGNRLTTLKNLNLPKLQHLYVAQNKLTSMADLVGTPILVSFHARGNRIESLDDFPTSLKCLTYLNLRSNLVFQHTQIIQLGYSPLRCLVLTGCPITRGVKYRMETITSVICLVRLDKMMVTQSDISTAMYLRIQREKGLLPEVRDEVPILTPPPTPASEWEFQEQTSVLKHVADELKLFPESMDRDAGFTSGVPSASNFTPMRKPTKKMKPKLSRKISLDPKSPTEEEESKRKSFNSAGDAQV